MSAVLASHVTLDVDEGPWEQALGNRAQGDDAAEAVADENQLGWINGAENGDRNRNEVFKIGESLPRGASPVAGKIRNCESIGWPERLESGQEIFAARTKAVQYPENGRVGGRRAAPNIDDSVLRQALKLALAMHAYNLSDGDG